MDGFKLFDSITIKNFLSFGPENEPFKMEPLNVLIGPNGSGKSNFIETFKFLRALPDNYSKWLGEKGDRYFIHNISSNGDFVIISKLSNDTAFDAFPNLDGDKTWLSHKIKMVIDKRGPSLLSESLYDNCNELFEFTTGNSKFKVFDRKNSKYEEFDSPKLFRFNKPIFSIISDPSRYPEMSYLSSSYKKLRFFGGQDYSPENMLRSTLKKHLQNNELDEDLSNILAMLYPFYSFDDDNKYVYNINFYLNKFFPFFQNFEIKDFGDYYLLYFYEITSKKLIPATRVSDGTLRFFALLAILCHPTPPPFICIEEPETGLHPDAISILGELLKEASQRTQIVVTTHSPDLVAEFTDMPEAVVVMDRDENGASTMNRLDGNRLKSWLENDYSLGKIWQSGEIGGNLY